MNNKMRFINFLISDFFIQFGAGMSLMAVGWYVMDITGSNYNVALFFAVNAICGIIMALFSWFIIDRIDKRKLIIGINFFRIITLAACLALITLNGFNLLYVLIIAISNGFGWNMYLPVSKSIIPLLSEQDELIATNSIAEMVLQVGMFSSGALSGFLYKIVGFQIIIILNIACFMISTIFIWTVKLDKSAAVNRAFGETPIAQLRDGLHYLASKKSIFLLGLIMYTPFVAAICIKVSLPGYVADVLRRDSAIYGIIDMFYGIGACVVGFLIIKFSKKLRPKQLILLCFTATILCAAILTMNTTVLFSCLALFAFGIGGPGIRILINSEIMSLVPANFLGRAMTTWNLFQLVLQLIASNLIGIIMDRMGAQYGFSIYAAVMLIGLLLYLGTETNIKRQGGARDFE